MAWDFSTEPEYQEQLDWARSFVTEKVLPIDALFPSIHDPYDRSLPVFRELVQPLQEEVKARGLWAATLPQHLGGAGLGAVKLALLNAVLGRSNWAPQVFGCMAPDTGNAEIIADYGTDEQKDEYVGALLRGDITSCYSMTEPQGGSDPNVFTCRAVRDGDEWVINGEKFMASFYPYATFVVAMIVTDPEAPILHGASMFLIPTDTPGMEMVRGVGGPDEPLGQGSHGYLRFTNCRVPGASVLGGEAGVDQGFVIAQTRLSGGRLHYGMRAVGMLEMTFEAMCERALSRTTKGSLLAQKQAVSHMLAESWIIIEQFRMQLMHAAWQVENSDYLRTRHYIAGVKVACAEAVTKVTMNAVHLHGALGMTAELPFQSNLWVGVAMSVMDGPSEVHKDVLARQVLKEHRATDGLWPSMHIISRRQKAAEDYGDRLKEILGDRFDEIAASI